MTHTCTLTLFAVLTLAQSGTADDAPSSPNLVANGDFEAVAASSTSPADWQTSGRADIHQSLDLDVGRQGQHSAKLTCTQFTGGTPDAHVMMCQVGKIAVEKGLWYRLSFWVKGHELEKPVGRVAISNTRPWGSSGVEGQFVAGKDWRHVELFCKATDSVPADTSRLQIWFSGTGMMWFDELTLQPVEMKEQFHPTISSQGVKNLLPNSSFECRSGQWGSYSPNISTWGGNLNQPFEIACQGAPLGVIDNTTARHGTQSLRIDIDKSTAPLFQWDYYAAAVEPIDTVLCANHGWIAVQQGQTYVLSAYLKADSSDVPAQLLVQHAQHGNSAKNVSVNTTWTRYSYTFSARADFIWIGVGLDLANSALPAAQLWLDALQLEAGDAATDYVPRSAVESTLSTSAVGNIFTQPASGLSIDIDVSNSAAVDRQVSGKITIRDFFDRQVFAFNVSLPVPAGSSRHTHMTDLLVGKPGFYRITWAPSDHSAPYVQSLRCALITPYQHKDSPFGMNHAYPWDFMLSLSQHAGITWMRDWSAKWNTVEPEQGGWDFSKVDPQIDRVHRLEMNPLVLLPFASASWCSSGDRELIKRHVGDDKYQMDRSIVACPATDPALFRNYVAKVTQRYQDRTRWIEVMNEPLYTTYSVPQAFGYDLQDYLQVLRDAHKAIKDTSPETNVIGGIGTWVDSHWVQDFIDAGGLQWCDAMDIHLYPVTVPPETYEAELAKNWKKMQERGEAKPIWLTEFGCYADDDPYKTPGQIGDSSMSRANWGSEQAASEALVKTAAVFLSNGIEKIFYHAGTCGPINSNNGGGIFFEYGGAPRKMYVAQNVLAHQLGPHPVAKPISSRSNDLHIYPFETDQGVVAIAWATDDDSVSLALPASIHAFDLMGTPVDTEPLVIGSTPIYLRAAQLDAMTQVPDLGLR